MVFDATVTLMLFCLTSLAYLLTGSPPGAASAALVLPLAWRRRHPVASGAAVCVVAYTQVYLGLGPRPADVAVLVSVYSLATYAPRWASWTGLGLALLGALGVVWLVRQDGTSFATVAGAAYVGLVLAAWTTGDLRRVRSEQVGALVERARRLEAEREQEARLAAAAERARIAREMHDVVAHSLSVIIAQADGGTYAGRTSPQAATEALATVAATGRAALTDMRSLLGVLRTSDEAVLSPLPDVADLPLLVEGVRGGGVAVELEVVGTARRMRRGAGLAAYRIVQEALTNVLKHAGPGARARVFVAWSDQGLQLSVEDDGRGAGSGVTDGADVAGQGLLGMTERASLYGGEVQAGARAGGGWVVRARLPYLGGEVG